MLKTRVKTAAVLTVLALIALYFSYNPYVLRAAAAALGVIAVWELYGVGGDARRSVRFGVSALLAAIYPFLPVGDYRIWAAAVLPIGMICFAVEARDLTRFSLFGRYTAFAYSLIVTVFFRAFPALREGENGLLSLLLPLVICVATDTGAYFLGRALGKHKLAPHISPGKSVEGAIGGAVCAAVFALLLCAVASAAGLATVRYGSAVLFALAVSAVGQLGDLSLSVLKRIAGVKDYGTLMPGHGGVLDRFDSMLFAAPLAVLLSWLLPVFS